jgi:peroxiredoxin (alkyl hydroperoxide reductase subunit C)
MSDSIQIGKMAPILLLLGLQESTRKIRLSDYHGKKYVILVFILLTLPLFHRLIKLSERISEFRRLSTQILAVSVDSPFSHLHYLLSKRSQEDWVN